MKFIVLLFALLSIASAEKWAVLVAGSEGYDNYRHQADVVHAYHILIQNGYKPENVILFSDNDVANSEYNPFPGELYNRPGNDSINYNADVIVDYEGHDCTPENYIKVLTGDDSTGKKVLKSTKDDTVFLAFFDHGAADLICFIWDFLYRTDLEKAFATMKTKQMYNKVVYYMEACYSGSMFVNLEKDGNIYALTAANTAESSWAYYCDEDETIVKGKDIGTCLGDEFSIKWMENVDEGNLKQTFAEHAEYITKAVDSSHVSKWGDLSFKDEPISEVFEGDLAHISKNVKYNILTGTRGDIYYNRLNFYKKLAAKNNSIKIQNELKKEEENIARVDAYFEELISKMKKFNKISEIIPVSNVSNMDCYKKSVESVKSTLGYSDYLLKYINVLASMCEQYPNTPAYL